MLISCDNENEIVEPEPINLSSNIEIYNEETVSDDFVFIVENSSVNSYLINKQGYKVYNWVFDKTSGNDLEILPNGNIIGSTSECCMQLSPILNKLGIKFELGMYSF